jgi:hypothetical protein
MASFGSSGAKDLLIRYHGIRGGWDLHENGGAVEKWVNSDTCMDGWNPKEKSSKTSFKDSFFGVLLHNRIHPTLS